MRRYISKRLWQGVIVHAPEWRPLLFFLGRLTRESRVDSRCRQRMSTARKIARP